MNRTKEKVPINAVLLRTLIKRKYGTINKMTSKLGINQKTIQRCLSDKETSLDTVYLLHIALNVDIELFADIEEYEKNIKFKMNNEKGRADS